MAGIEKGVGFPITAADQFSSAFDKLKARVTETHSSFDRLKSLMTAAFAGISVAGLVMVVKHAIDAADELGKLSQKTGIAVDQLSKLSYGAKLADLDLESFSKGMKSFAGKLVEASEGTSKAARLFRALGVDINAGPAKAIEQFAEGVSRMRDGEVKTALATEILSKSGMNMIPWLNAGAAGFRKAADEAQRLGIVLSTETAKAAEEFNDNLKALQQSTNAFGIAVVNMYGQGLVNATGAMKEALIEGGKLKMLWVGLGAVGAFLFTDEMLSAAEKYRKKIAELNEQMAMYNKEAAIAAARGAPFKAYETAASRVLGEINATMRLQELQNGARWGEDSVSRRLQQGRQLSGPQGDGGEANIRRLLSEKKELTAASDSLVAALQKELAKVSNLSGEDKKLEEVMIEIAKLKKDGKTVAEGEILRLALLIDQKKEELRIDKFLTEEHQKDLDFARERGISLEAMANDWDDMTRALKEEVNLLGKSNLEREKAILLRKRDEDITAANRDAATIRDINKAYEDQVALLERRNELQKSLDVWNEVADRGAQLFSDLVTSGKNAFDVLKNAVRDFGRELLAIFAKRWILQMAATATGSTALASAAGQAGVNTAAGGVASWAGSAIGGATGFTGFAEGVQMGWASGMAAPGAGMGEMMGAGMAEAWAAIYEVLAMIPVWGWIVMAIIAVGAWLTGRGGGPKFGGSSFGSFSPRGDFIGATSVPGSDNGRFYTPNQADSAMDKLRDSIAEGFFSTLQRYGGSINGPISLGIGMDTDPQGTAANRVTTLGQMGGRTFFSRTREAGRDDKDIQTEIADQIPRLILAGLQASILPQGLADIFSTLSAETGSQEQIKALFALADAFSALKTAAEGIDLDKFIADLTRGPNDRFRDMGHALTDMAGKTQITVESMQRMTQATMEFKGSVAQLVAGFEQAKIDIAAMFADTSRSIQLAGLSEQQQYNFYQNEADNLLTQIQGSTSADEIRRYSGVINQDITSAFSLLSPEQQLGMKQDYLERIATTNTTIQDRLAKVQKDTVDEANRVLKEIKDIMDKNAADFKAAAGTISTAGQDISNAASNQTVRVEIDVEDHRLNTVVNGG